MELSRHTQDYLAFFGRICLSLVFVVAGISKVLSFQATASGLASQGVPMSELMLLIGTVIELGASLMVLLGWQARLGALLLFIFVIPVTFMFHAFWGFQGAEMIGQMQHFLKNLAIMGGCLYVMLYGSGAYSLDSLRNQ